MIILDEFIASLRSLGIQEGDTLFVQSDITVMLYDGMKEKLKPEDIVEVLLNLIGQNGDLIFPTYNWDFCKGVPFDYKSTPSKTGALSSAALAHPAFKRTRHPIYSFAVYGRDAKYLASLEYKDSFGADSIFAWFDKVAAKNLFINVSYQHSATFIHYVEEKLNVPYRFIKTFSSDYTDADGNTTNRSYSMFVRYLDREVETTIDPMHEVFLKNNAVKEVQFKNSYLRVLDMQKACELVADDILNNNCERIASYDGQVGDRMYSLAKRLFPICRSITGNGVRETLSILKEECPLLNTFEVPSGSVVFDWTVPKEWNVKDAYVKNSKGEKIIDFKTSNLHLMGYSVPIHQKVSKAELFEHLYTLPEQPNLIPYVTSYYKERWGFCISENEKSKLTDDEYEVFIDSELKDGSLTYGEILIQGETDDEIFLSTYVCHPSMANDDLSGPVVTISLAKWLMNRKNNYSYRIIFIPETIGSITYLSKNMDYLKKHVRAGYVLTCVGDPGHFSYVASRYGNTLADRAALAVLKGTDPEFISYSFLARGSDERQYSAPGVDLPVCSVTRSKYGVYPEYHTSADNLEYVTSEALDGSYKLYKTIIELLEANKTYKNNVLCEPQLGKRGLYPTISTKDQGKIVENMMNTLAYIDGRNDLISISEITSLPPMECQKWIEKFLEAGLIEKEI